MDKKTEEKLDKIIKLLEEIKAKPEYHYYPPIFYPSVKPWPEPQPNEPRWDSYYSDGSMEPMHKC